MDSILFFWLSIIRKSIKQKITNKINQLKVMSTDVLASEILAFRTTDSPNYIKGYQIESDEYEQPYSDHISSQVIKLLGKE